MADDTVQPVQFIIIRKGEQSVPMESPAPTIHAAVNTVVGIEDGTLGDRPSVMLIGTSEDGQTIALELTWQIFDMLDSGLKGAFGEPTSEFQINFKLPFQAPQQDNLRG